MIILGINDNHDAAAAIVTERGVEAAVSQERMDRVKCSRAFPWEAIEEVLRLTGYQPHQIDRIVMGSVFTPIAALRKRGRFREAIRQTDSQFSYLLNGYVSYQVAARKLGFWTWEMEASRRLLSARFKERGFTKAVVSLLDHHTSHAASAYRSQPHNRALAITIDAMGDGASVTVSIGENGELRRVFTQSGFAAINTYYSRITEYLGFRPNRHEGKLTGLAAYEPDPPELREHFRKQLHCRNGRLSRTNYLVPQSRTDRFHSFLANYSKEQISAALQRNLEDTFRDFVAFWVKRTGIPDVVLAGGVCANVKLNQEIHEVPEVRSLWVYPNMGDGGLAAGAGLFYGSWGPASTPSVYLGTDIDEQAAAAALEGAGLTFSKPADLAGEVAGHLAESRVIARASGRMEWGPRALGNRTIMYRPDDPSVNRWLNQKLKRTEFMPFAPSTLWEARQKCYVGIESAADPARFMTVCFDCTPFMKERCGGVVHIDGTARPQLVKREDNPGYYDIIQAFEARTGAPSVINTSFNMHEEPIVRTADEAIKAFTESRLDYLVLGPFLVEGAGLSEGPRSAD